MPEALPEQERRHTAHTTSGPRFLQLRPGSASSSASVTFFGAAAGIVGAIFGSSTDVLGLLAIIALVGVGEASRSSSTTAPSPSAAGALAGAALFGRRAALALASTTAIVQWSAKRGQIHHVLFNVGAPGPRRSRPPSSSLAGFDGGLGS